MTLPRFNDLRKKLDLIFHLRVFGTVHTNEEKAKALQPDYDGTTESAAKSLSNWRKNNHLPTEQVLLLIEALTKSGYNLSANFLCNSSYDDFSALIARAGDIATKADQSSCVEAIVDYFRHRPEHQRYCREYYSGESFAHLADDSFQRFPLLVARGWMLTKPRRIDNALERDLLAQRSNFHSTDRFCKAVSERNPLEQLKSVTNMTLREEAFKVRNLADGRNDSPPAFDGQCWRLMSVEVRGTKGDHKLHFERSSYFGYLNSLEMISSESAVMKQGGRALDEALPAESLRGSPAQAFEIDALHRNSMVGVNTITILRDGDKLRFYKHFRANVSEAIKTFHVVPAGTFQPNLPSGMNNLIRSERWTKEFSVLETVKREFCEEVLGLVKEIRDSQKRVELEYDWQRGARASEMVRAFDEGVSNGKIVPFYFGLGLDPCTLKPEVCTALVVDQKYFDECFRPDWMNGEEGVGVLVELDPDTLEIELSDDRSQWLSAGEACVRLAIKHLKLLF